MDIILNQMWPRVPPKALTKATKTLCRPAIRPIEMEATPRLSRTPRPWIFLALKHLESIGVLTVRPWNKNGVQAVPIPLFNSRIIWHFSKTIGALVTHPWGKPTGTYQTYKCQRAPLELELTALNNRIINNLRRPLWGTAHLIIKIYLRVPGKPNSLIWLITV